MILEESALASETIHVGRLNDRITDGAKHVRTLIVRDDHEDVGTLAPAGAAF